MRPILALVLEKNEQNFSRLVERFEPKLRWHVNSFMRDPMVNRVEDEDSLKNISLIKLWEAFQNFVYDGTLTEIENEMRFLSMVKTYVYRDMIDYFYHENADKRKPKDGLVNLEGLAVDGADFDGDSNFRSLIPDRSHSSAHEYAVVSELKEYVNKRVDKETADVFELLSMGFTTQHAAGRLGIAASRVAYLLSRKIRPLVDQYQRC